MTSQGTEDSGPDVADIERRRAELEESAGYEWHGLSIDRRLEAAAQRWPIRTYLTFGQESHSYAEVLDRSLRIATSLAASGVEAGTHVGVLMDNCLDFYAITFAVARLGGWTVPLNYLLAPSELAHVISHSRCSLIILGTDLSKRDGIGLLAATLESLPEAADAPGVRVLIAPAASPSPPPCFEHAPLAVSDVPYNGPSRGLADAISHVYYTSGSTALPKAVTVTHDAMLREAYGSALSRAYADEWRVITALPPFHIFGLMQAVLAVIFVGGTAVVERTFDAERMLSQIVRHRVRDCIAVPAMSQRLVAVAREKEFDLSSLTAMYTAGDAVPETSWRDLRNILGVSELSTGYGMTEAPGIAFIVRPEDPIEVLANTVGRPKMAGVAGIRELHGRQHRVLIIDKDTNRPVPDGVDGEICFGGPTVTREYFDNDTENVRCFRDGYVRSGDVGHIREDGCLVLTGRLKEMFRSGGENVTPKEVEAALYSHPAVEQAIVVGVPDEDWGESGCAWIVPVRGAAVTPEELIEHCRQRLARYKVPHAVYLIAADDLPLTALGKLKRQDLIDRAVARSAAARSSTTR